MQTFSERFLAREFDLKRTFNNQLCKFIFELWLYFYFVFRVKPQVKRAREVLRVPEKAVGHAPGVEGEETVGVRAKRKKVRLML